MLAISRSGTASLPPTLNGSLDRSPPSNTPRAPEPPPLCGPSVLSSEARCHSPFLDPASYASASPSQVDLDVENTWPRLKSRSVSAVDPLQVTALINVFGDGSIGSGWGPVGCVGWRLSPSFSTSITESRSPMEGQTSSRTSGLSVLDATQRRHAGRRLRDRGSPPSLRSDPSSASGLRLRAGPSSLHYRSHRAPEDFPRNENLHEPAG